MRVEITEEKLRDTEQLEDGSFGQSYNLAKGDTVTVSDSLGRKWCGLGWARDVDGNVATGKRIPGARAVDVQSATHQRTLRKAPRNG